ncbi:hypothetical protein Enr13x_01950 [Stieleria neptunia]|uniref:Uncharacterized protein n=1 Tax=Stieleria neptunia TaxID=2527979 RepID=A0A518HHW4_9BACT|nr:hypothetical protein Enr13x_01950 [Stieleria neptunia]
MVDAIECRGVHFKFWVMSRRNVGDAQRGSQAKREKYT